MDLSFAAPHQERRRRELLGLPQLPEPPQPGLMTRMRQMLGGAVGARR
jgi:hypothetical protein